MFLKTFPINYDLNPPAHTIFADPSELRKLIHSPSSLLKILFLPKKPRLRA